MKKESVPERAATEIEHRIIKGELTGKLPSMTELARTLNISPVSARAALHLLEEKGLVEIRHGRGTRVSYPKVDEGLLQNPFDSKTLASLTVEAEALSKHQLFAIGLHLFTQRRVAEVAFEEHPNNTTLQRFLTTAGREAILASLLENPEKAGEGATAAGIRRMFSGEIRDFEEAPTIGDALASIGSEPRRF